MSYLKLEKINIFLLSLFVFGLAKNGSQHLANFGLYGAIFTYIVRFALYKKEMIANYKAILNTNKILLFSLFLFLFSILLSIIFAYSNSYFSLLEFEDEFFKIFIFFIIGLSIKDKKFIYYILIALIITYFYDIIAYAIKYIKHNPHMDFSGRLERKWSDYCEILLPFLLGGLFIFKNKILKILIFIAIYIGLLELFLTGARGGWVSVFAEIILFFGVLIYYHKRYFKKVAFVFTISGIFLYLGGFFLYKHSSLIQQKMHQGTDTSGRDMIVKTRLPIFVDKGNLIVGIGGPGSYQYVRFLNDYNAPKIYGNQYKTRFEYWADEPFLLQIFYKEGLFGLFCFIFLSYIFLSQMLRYIKDSIYENQIYLISILTSFFGVYLIRGLVEGRDLKYLIFYIILFIFIKKEQNVKNQ